MMRARLVQGALPLATPVASAVAPAAPGSADVRVT
jgi:hypothetical protein